MVAKPLTKKKRHKAERIMTLLKRHRLANGLTLHEVAKRIGVSVGTVSAWETGRNLPRPRSIKRLAMAMNVSALDLTRIIVPDNGSPVEAK